MFGGDNHHKDQTTQTTQPTDPGYLGSLENPVDGGVAPQGNDLMGAPVQPPTAAPDPSLPAVGTTDQPAVDLVSIKQQALQQLSPLVGHLEQSPEERFRTTMMMIQATDDQTLLPKAYDAANQILDEKVKAQALLDVINEINYFTQQK